MHSKICKQDLFSPSLIYVFFFGRQKAYIYASAFSKAIVLGKSFKILLDIYYLEIDFIAASSSVLLQLDGFGQRRTYLGKKSVRNYY